MIKQFLLLLTIALVGPAFVFAQKDKSLDKYKPRTLAEIAAISRKNTEQLLAKTKIGERSDFISLDLFYSRVRLQFLGDVRPLAADHRDLMKTWSKLQNVGKKTTDLYEEEFLFKEGERQYWIPMQKKIGEGLRQEIAPGETTTLFVIHVGGRTAAMSPQFEWLFLSVGYEN